MAREMSDYFEMLKQALQTASPAGQASTPELRILAFGRMTSVPLRTEDLAVGSGLDCDLAVGGLPAGVAFRLTLTGDGSATLSNGPMDLTLLDPEHTSVPPGGSLALEDAFRWSVGETEFQLSLPRRAPAPGAALGLLAPGAFSSSFLGKFASARIPLGVGAIVVGALTLVTAWPDPQAAIASVPSLPIAAKIPAPSSQDGTLADLRRRLIEAGVASRVTVANTPTGLVYDIRGSDPERAHIEAMIETARQTTPVTIIRRPSDLDPFRKKVAALFQMPEPRILMTDGRSYSVGEIVHLDWKLEAVGSRTFVLSRGTERTTVDLREGDAS